MIAKKVKFVATISLVLVISAIQATAQSQGGSTPAPAEVGATTSTQSANKAGTKAPGRTAAHTNASASEIAAANTNASASEIAAAKSTGKVWVNTDSGVYHKSGRWYGKTKAGKFMTESEAKAAGYKEAKKQ